MAQRFRSTDGGAIFTDQEHAAMMPWIERQTPVPLGLREAPEVLADKVRGMLFGVAVGDSLGNTSEGMSPERRRRRFGEIRDYLPHPREDMRRVGFPSDDTQMTFWTVESLIRQGRLDLRDLADSFVGPRIFGIGKTVTDFLFAYRFEGRPWFEAGRPSAGNGALMRIAPVLLPHLSDMSVALWPDVIAATVLTHRGEAAVTASVGFTGLLAECLAWDATSPPASEWWVETFLRYARPMETPREALLSRRSIAADERTDGWYASRVAGDPFEGSLCDRVEQVLSEALEQGISVLESAEEHSSGAFLLETMPCVLHTLARHGGDTEEAIIRAANDTWDNDTIAAIVGAAVGALHGVGALPPRWLEAHLGRTGEADDGRVQGLVEEAVARFVVGGGRSADR